MSKFAVACNTSPYVGTDRPVCCYSNTRYLLDHRYAAWCVRLLLSFRWHSLYAATLVSRVQLQWLINYTPLRRWR